MKGGNHVKVCKFCLLVKPISKFVKNKNCLNGYENKCKECKNQRLRQWYIDNREKENERSRKWYVSNPEKVQKYVINNREKIRKRKKQWCLNNREKICERSKKWHEIYCKNLEDTYIKHLLIQGSELKFNDFPPEIIDLKRKQITLKRLKGEVYGRY